MKIKQTAVLLTAAAIAMSSFCSLTAGAVVFTEDDTTGIKTWTFNVTENPADYPDNIGTDTNGDRTFSSGATYYVSNGYSASKPGNDYLTLQVGNSGTKEGVEHSSLYLNQNKNETSSGLSWTVPTDGTITLTTYNELNLSINDVSYFLEWSEHGTQRTYTVKEGDSVKISAPRYGSIHELKFIPTHTELYSFEKTFNELQDGTLEISYNDGNDDKSISKSMSSFTASLPNVDDSTNTKLGLIINDIPNYVTINSVVIE